MKAQFLLSTLDEFPVRKSPKGTLLPEIAFVGRSNVGKSSLINHLFNQKKLARTSSTPGKTRLLNFFSIEDRFLLVDLPGYGFAKAPKHEIETWSRAIDQYFNERVSLKLIFLLVDCRREFSKEDRSIMSWAEHKQTPLLRVFTKTDKLSQSEKAKLMKTYPNAIHYSVTNTKGRHLIEKCIEKEALSWD